MQFIRRFSFTMLLMSMMTLLACGGEGGDLTGGGESGDIGTTDDLVISLAISNRIITGEAPITVIAKLSGSSAISNQLITFSSTLGVFSPALGTALTDLEGSAEIILTAGSVRGAGEITASLSTGQEAKIGFTTQGDDINVVGDVNILLTLVDSDGNPTETITSSKSGKVI
ncbi:MAG TPA: hypothetical protein DIS98_07315, partial [Colwellia sp.]|nr:hypothetical protein [Colwellia sp.]